MSKVVREPWTHTQKVRMLYKTVLRLHRGKNDFNIKGDGLPPELRDLGDKYTRDEFRRHKGCKPMEAQLFMTEWTKYAVTISTQLGLRGKPKGTLGDTIDEKFVEQLNDDQAVQLYELCLAAKGLDADKITPEDLQKK